MSNITECIAENIVKKLFGEKDVGSILQRLDRLTQDEARTTAVETLKVIYGLIQEMSEHAHTLLFTHRLLSIFPARRRAIS